MKFEVHGHISGSNSLVNLLTPLVKNLQIFSAVTLVGLLIAITFFIREERGKLSSEGLRVKTLARLAAVIWSVATLGVLLFDLANILDSSIGQTLNLVVIRSFISQTSLGTALFINLAAAIAVALLLGFVKKTGSALLLLLLTFIGVIAPLFQSHSSSSGSHSAATGSLIYHVIFISIWVGGVIGLIIIAPKEREIAIPRFSSLALWAASIVVISEIGRSHV